MKRTLIPTLVFIVLATASFAQNVVTDSTATVVGYWKKGEKIKLLLTKTKEKFEDSKSMSKASSTSTIEITVLEATEKTYTLQWKYTSVTVPGAESNPFVQKMAKLTEGIAFKYKTDEMGSFAELLNLEEVKKVVDRTLDELLKVYKTNDAINVVTQFKQIFSNRESFEQVMMKELQLYHSLYGGEYKLHEKITAPIELPNVATGKPFPAVLSIEMTQLAPAANTCQIKMSQTIDREKAGAIIQEIIAKLDNDKSRNHDAFQIDVNDSSEFDVELKTGWINRAFHKREMAILNVKNVETLELKKL